MKKWIAAHFSPAGAALLLLVTAGLCVAVAWHFSCPVQALLGIPCPACGMTRAVYALLRFPPDFAAAWRENALVYLLPLCGFLLLTGGRPFAVQRRNTALLYALLAAVAVWYGYALLRFFL